MKKVLVINTSDTTGGAAIAANRIMQIFEHDADIDAKMLVMTKSSNDKNIISAPCKLWIKKFCFVWERVVIWISNGFNKKNLFNVSIANTGTDITKFGIFQDADIIHLHWINQGFLSTDTIGKILKSGKRVIWTMHDMWSFTGICHHAEDCEKYHEKCYRCPQLVRPSYNDLSAKCFEEKRKKYEQGKIIFVGCSEWIATQARKSRLTIGHDIVAIPNPIDLNIYQPKDKLAIRQRLNLPLNKKLILFCSRRTTDVRKGMEYLIDACKLLEANHSESKQQMAVVILGGDSEEFANLIPLPAYSMGYVGDERMMANIYNAVDVFVTPSLCENLPNTIMEAMACGTPCVGFDIGGVPEMIDHMKNGYVAKYKSAQDFADGIWWVINDITDLSNISSLSVNARQKVVEYYSPEQIAKKYKELYFS
ncbi:MAG: glycosyltransferase family 4 protein [Prevotellaceae bacterium]|nr:glycosyltransferase family 4 protein [Candidatus Faecinaster equi]